eukprot:CAMPEP_0171453154 /NCGR_PEP_ID=MMETSP0945-20130129/976_1 /TAXON_ID=109269 /ORGANISM="Vaucheria litorea, Strain CCMP2940" /LENGTH=681 /DNA_ID=CAMNT_0011977965 /DNA_START=173 /DNA_END=2218 /DNA_ORIENTATION=-
MLLSDEIFDENNGKSGRKRGAKKGALISTFSSYNAYFNKLLSSELEYEKEQMYNRLNTPNSSHSILNMQASFRGRLFREKVFRFHAIFGENKTYKTLPYNQLFSGDIVSVSAGNKLPITSLSKEGVGTTNFLNEGVVVSRSKFYLEIAFKRVPDHLRIIEQSCRFRVDKVLNGVSYKRQFEALEKSTAALSTSIRDIVIFSLKGSLERYNRKISESGEADESNFSKPEYVQSIASEYVNLGFSKGSIEDLDSQSDQMKILNTEQRKILKSSLGRRLTLIQGPPGTGKTYTACALLHSAVLLRRGSNRATGKILGTAFSNAAADNLLKGCIEKGLRCVRIGRVATVGRELWDASLDAQLEKHPLMEPFSNFSGKSKASNGSDWKEREKAEVTATRDILSKSDVIICSCIGSGNDQFLNVIQKSELFSESLQFTTVLIDEATQATEPSCLIPLLNGCEQLILVGDQNQLPPTVLSESTSNKGLSVSLFTRLIYAGIKPFLLTRQYRMHPKIAEFPNNQFYSGKLVSMTDHFSRPLPKGFDWPNSKVPVAFLDLNAENFEKRIKSDFSVGSTSFSLSNLREAREVISILSQFLAKNSPESIGVISPYSGQVRLIQDLFKEADISERVEVRSVDGFQGREKNIIIFDRSKQFRWKNRFLVRLASAQCGDDQGQERPCGRRELGHS